MPNVYLFVLQRLCVRFLFFWLFDQLVCWAFAARLFFLRYLLARLLFFDLCVVCVRFFLFFFFVLVVFYIKEILAGSHLLESNASRPRPRRIFFDSLCRRADEGCIDGRIADGRM